MKKKTPKMQNQNLVQVDHQVFTYIHQLKHKLRLHYLIEYEHNQVVCDERLNAKEWLLYRL